MMTITKHIIVKTVNPPMIIPIHAMDLPASPHLFMFPKATNPNIRAKRADKKLVGKQMKPVNGNGNIPMQKERNVRTPKTRLKTDCVLMEGEEEISFITIKTLLRQSGSSYIAAGAR
jgi:hypothetical protein